jgi:serralysin
MASVEMALSFWSDVCGIKFQRVNDNGSQYSDDATMLFGCYSAYDGAGAYAYYPGNYSEAGDVWLNLTSVSSQAQYLTPGQYSFFAILHEIGHAIGLSHPGLYNAGVGQTITYANNAQFVQDTQQYSVMSYFDEASAGLAQYFGYSDAPMLFDVLSIQNIYGVNSQTRAGNTTYGYNSTAGSSLFDFTRNTTPALCLWDGDGVDTLDCSQYSAAQTIDLTQGGFSSVLGLTRNISIAYGAVIENAIGGSGADYILGNEAANSLTGGDGFDTLSGSDGNDTLSGNNGADVLQGGRGRDYLGGGKGHDSLFGGQGADTLIGGMGNDTLTGGRAGDSMTGGEAIDTFVFTSDAGDLAAGLIDTISDFTTGTDKIDLTAISAQFGTLSFVDTLQTSVRGVTFDANSKFLSIDWTADGQTDMRIVLENTNSLTAADLML